MESDATETKARKTLSREERQARRARRAAAGKPVPAAGAKGGAKGAAKGADPAETRPRTPRTGKASAAAPERARAKKGGITGRDAAAKATRRVRGEVLSGRGAAPGRPVAARKVMVISFQKTGTTTMTDALRSLGLSVAHVTQAINMRLKGKKLSTAEADDIVQTMALEIADRADAVQDSPYPLLFKELDARYPGSKFIYLEREVESWVKSVIGHFGTGSTELRDWIYGESKPVGNEDIYRKRYLEHRDAVHAYFADRPDDILYMDLPGGDGWLKLVDFLGPDFLPPFPHRNKRG